MVLVTSWGVLVRKGKINGFNNPIDSTSDGTYKVLPNERLKENTHQLRWVLSKDIKQMD